MDINTNKLVKDLGIQNTEMIKSMDIQDFKRKRDKQLI